MNPKQLKKLKKRIKKAQKVLQQPKYIEELTQYRDLFDPFPEVKFLINNALESCLKTAFYHNHYLTFFFLMTFKIKYSRTLTSIIQRAIHGVTLYGINIQPLFLS